MQTLGQRIAFYRKAANMTQSELADACSVTAQAVSKWENDLTAPDLSLLPKLAELFRITTDELLGVQKQTVTAVDPAAMDLNKMLFRVRVLSADGDKVNVNLPLALARLVLENDSISVNMFGGESGEMLKNIDWKQLFELVRQGALGKLVEVDGANGDKVEVWIE